MLKIFVALSILLAGALAQAKPIVLNTLNTVTFRGTVDGNSITEAQLALTRLVQLRGNADYTIYLVLDSPGGSIIAGDAFIQFAKTIRNLETISIFAASMASAIVEALPGKRYVTANGIVMFHRAAGQFQGYFEDGEIEAQLKMWKSIVRNMEEVNSSRIGISLQEYKSRVIGEYWLYGKEAVTANVVDETADILCSQELIKKREVVVAETIMGSMDTTWSGCPLFRIP